MAETAATLEGDPKPNTVKLVVTLFSKPPNLTEKASDSSGPGPFTPISAGSRDLEASLRTTMHSVLTLTTTSLLSSTYLSPRIIQQVYLTVMPTEFSAIKLRRSPLIKHLEKTTSSELTLRLLPSNHPWPPKESNSPPLKLAIFDMDSTLIDQEVIDELARTINITPLVSAITARAMAGELDFAESLKERVALLKGVKADVWEELKGKVTFARGARELCRALKRLGVKMAVLSGGFQPMAEWVKGELGLNWAYANHLLVSDPTAEFSYRHISGHLSPHPNHPIVTPQQKSRLLQEIASSEGIPLSEVLCVGDGANDLLMMKVTGEGEGMGVGFRGKERVQMEAPNRLNSESLVDMLYLYGYTAAEVEELTKE
ncbi:MAG: hypothetical protein MMC33_006092 [Icmadophila ericetorum]|nr:hypothetical protein [Icmadophila ericetorum]